VPPIRFRSPALQASVVEKEWMTNDQLEMLMRAFEDWGKRPDAFAAMTAFGAFGFVR
jgi:hypothetical protein